MENGNQSGQNVCNHCHHLSCSLPSGQLHPSTNAIVIQKHACRGQNVAEVLGVPMETIRLRTADPEMNMTGNPTGGSRSLLAFGSVFLVAAQEVVKKGLALAAEKMETAEADIEFSEGRYRVKGTDREVALNTLVKMHAGNAANPLDLDKRDMKVGATFPNGCHISEVEIDPETGEAEIVRYTACDDAGNVINHQIVEGQMQGGITQGAGHIFGEQAIYDRETGQLLTGSFMDYPMPRAILVDGLKVLEHPVPTQTNPSAQKAWARRASPVRCPA